MTDVSRQLEERKTRARAWFERLRDDICAALEELESALPAKAPLGDRAPAVSRARLGNAQIIPAVPAAAA